MVYVAIEVIPYEGEILKGVFTNLKVAKSAAVSDKQADYHIAKVIEISMNVKLRLENKKVVWRESQPQ